MASRIAERFDSLRAAGRTGLVTYVTAGDPDLATSADIVRALDPIFLLSPTTSDARIRASSDLGRGFLYVISRLGVTGARDQVAADAESLVTRIRAHSDLPLALGFGISTPGQVAEVGRWADAAVVGSALVNVIAEHGAAPDVAGRAGAWLRWLKGRES